MPILIGESLPLRLTFGLASCFSCARPSGMSRVKASASIAQWLEPRSSDPAVVGLSPGWGGHICACHIEV